MKSPHNLVLFSRDETTGKLTLLQSDVVDAGASVCCEVFECLSCVEAKCMLGCRYLSVSRYSLSKRRYIEKIVDIISYTQKTVKSKAISLCFYCFFFGLRTNSPPQFGQTLCLSSVHGAQMYIHIRKCMLQNLVPMIDRKFDSLFSFAVP